MYSSLNSVGYRGMDDGSLLNWYFLIKRISIVWTCLNMSEHVWTCLNMSEHVWACLNMFEHIWTCLNMFDQLTCPSSLIVIKDSNNNVFGAFVSSPIKESKDPYGTGEIWSIKSLSGPRWWQRGFWCQPSLGRMTSCGLMTPWGDMDLIWINSFVSSCN